MPDGTFEAPIAIPAEVFVSLQWEHVRTTLSTLGETAAYSGSTVWSATYGERKYRLQWDWMFEPFFQRPFTMDMQPHTNAIFAAGDFVAHALPLDERTQTLRSAIDRIKWEDAVLMAMEQQDKDHKVKVERILKGVSRDIDPGS
ncbi:MAG: hypothetical protein KGZ70_13020 [Hydrogenophaga sp.]|nr:hypothetical protein [Hydrogenophaga sp.]